MFNVYACNKNSDLLHVTYKCSKYCFVSLHPGGVLHILAILVPQCAAGMGMVFKPFRRGLVFIENWNN